jgi:hypothetical protein
MLYWQGFAGVYFWGEKRHSNEFSLVKNDEGGFLYVETPCWRLNLADKKIVDIYLFVWIDCRDLDANMASLRLNLADKKIVDIYLFVWIDCRDLDASMAFLCLNLADKKS